MRFAYSTRVVADYNPEIKVEFENGSFELNKVAINTAKGWPLKAKAYMDSIYIAWSQMDG